MEESGAKLYSKHFYTILKNKSMSIPTNFIEDISRRAPEKPKPPVLSTFRRLQLEGIQEREFVRAKRSRILFHVDRKFVNKFGSAHKKVILATIEKYFVGKEYLTLEKHDICQLESMIISSINQKIEDTLILKPSEPKTEPLVFEEESLDGVWASADQHRSLSKVGRIIGGLENNHNVKTRRLVSSLSEARLEKALVKAREIEHYRKPQFQEQTTKLLNFDDLRERKNVTNNEEKKFREQKFTIVERLRKEAARREKSMIRKERAMLQTERGAGATNRSDLTVNVNALTNTSSELTEKETIILKKNNSSEGQNEDNYHHFRVPVCISANESLSCGGRDIFKKHQMGNITDDVNDCSSSEHGYSSMSISKSNYVELHPRQIQSSDGKLTRLEDERRVNFKLSRRTFRNRVLAKYKENQNNGNTKSHDFFSTSESNTTSPYSCTRW